MSIFEPTVMLKRVTDISPELLRKMGIKALLLDVDNTIAVYDSKTPYEGSLRWTEKLKEEGFLLYIVSNNYRDRVKGIAAKFGLPFVSFAMKPFPVGFIKLRRRLGLKKKECLVVGDQIFTDILGAKLGGMPSALLEPIKIETGLSFTIRRKLEAKLRPGFESKKRKDVM